jgi:phosphatidylglycerophosphate synthase
VNNTAEEYRAYPSSGGNVNAKFDSLSGVDDDSKFEYWMTTTVVKPLCMWIPDWFKPNTISIINNFVCWLELVLAFLSVQLDESAEEYNSGVMNEGRTLWGARSAGYACRLAIAFLVFASMVLDCMDGMHARRTKQCSHLGEIMDHALDSMNIPLTAVAVCVSFRFDKLSVAIGSCASGLVFNSQLVVYRHTGKFMKPPTNGVEAQGMIVATYIGVGALMAYFGRHSPYFGSIVVGISVFGNIIQLNNCRHFWSHMNRHIMHDHLVFAVLMVTHSVTYFLGLITHIMYTIGTILIAFRLSGTYVLYTVVNKPRKEKVHSRISSMYSGWDWNVIAWLVLFTVVPIYFEGLHAGFLNLGPQGDIDLMGSAKFYDVYLTIFFVLHMYASMLFDISDQINNLDAQNKDKPLLRLLF